MGRKSNPDRWFHVRNGFRRAGAILLGAAWLGVIFYGWGVINSSPRMFAASALSGWSVLAFAGAVAVLATEKWLKALPGLFAYAGFSCLLAFWNGHFGLDASRPVPRSSAAIMTILVAASAALALTLKERKANAFDRGTVLALYISFVSAGLFVQSPLLPFFLMFVCISTAAAARRFQRIPRAESEGRMGVAHRLR